jgi:hypothetical protein
MIRPAMRKSRALTCAARAGAAAALLLAAARLDAQTGAGHVEAGFQVMWTAEDRLGSGSAVLESNPTTDTRPFTLFSTDVRARRSVGLGATLGYRVARWLTLEGAGRMRRPDVVVSITGDAEGAPDRTFVGERLTEYAIELSGVVELPLEPGARLRPFVLGGGGYRRELHEGNAALETGSSLHGGGGAKVTLVERRGRVKAVGVRGDVRATRRRGGFHLDRATATVLSAGAGVFFVF